MGKKKARKASKSVKNLPVKTASAKTARGVKGGGLNYGTIKWEYKPQKPDGSLGS
jgi:hypothetical protein